MKSRNLLIEDPAQFLEVVGDRKTNITALARDLGVSTRTIYTWAKKFRAQIDTEKAPSPDRDEAAPAHHGQG